MVSRDEAGALGDGDQGAEIVKQVDEKTRAKTSLNELLRTDNLV